MKMTETYKLIIRVLNVKNRKIFNIRLSSSGYVYSNYNIDYFYCYFLNFPIESLAHRDGCHRWHTCPSDTGNCVCGDLGHGCGSSEEEDNDEEEDTEPADEGYK